jgi:hypothetical protein
MDCVSIGDEWVRENLAISLDGIFSVKLDDFCDMFCVYSSVVVMYRKEKIIDRDIFF